MIFGPDRFSKDVRQSVSALWDWYHAVAGPGVDSEDAERVRTGNRPVSIPRLTWERAEAACTRHGLDVAHLADRLEASALLRSGSGPARGAELNGFVDLLVGRHAVMLARLAGYRGSWQHRGAIEFARGLEIIRHLVCARDDARRGISLFCTEEMDQNGLTIRRLAGNEVPQGYRRLAWKQSIRAREALAGSLALIAELDRRDRSYAKRVWLGALEYIHLLDQRDFDVWTRPAELSPIARARVGIQSIFGRTAFRSK